MTSSQQSLVDVANTDTTGSTTADSTDHDPVTTSSTPRDESPSDVSTEQDSRYNPTVGMPGVDLRQGDVVIFPRKQIHALLRPAGDYSDEIALDKPRPDRVDLVWLDGYDRAFRTHGILRETLEAMGRNNKLRIVDEGIKNRAALNRAPGVRHPNRYSRDGTVQPGSRIPVSELSFDRIYSLKRANGFLKHPVIDHKHGRVQKAKGIFTATRPDGRIAAITTVNSVNARMAFDRETIEITRYASHPETPSHQATNNTATWMLSRICRWAALEGYETIRTYAGTDGNDGRIYEASNFTFAGVANSSGAYNRDGRENQSHTNELRRYTKELCIDGENARSSIPRRVESRLESDTETTGSATTLSSFSSSKTPRTPANFEFTREDVTDYKFARGVDSNEYPDFSHRLHDLISETDVSLSLSDAASARRNGLPAAAFGAVVDGVLVAALLVRGDPTNRIATTTVSGYVARETRFPAATARWLLSRARDWAMLSGYTEIRVPRTTFTPVDDVKPTVPKGVSFTETGDAVYRYSK